MLFVFDRLLRETVLTMACEMGDPDALKEASNIFNQWIDEKLRYCITNPVEFLCSNPVFLIKHFKLTYWLILTNFLYS